MSALQAEALQYMKYIPEMPDDKLRILIDTFRGLVAPVENSAKDGTVPEKRSRKIGSMKGIKFIADGHDIDDYNDEIVRMFGAAADENTN